MKRIKVLYRKNLKMSADKQSAQAVHAAIGLYKLDPQNHHSCIVLGISDKKFREKKVELAETHPASDPESDLCKAHYIVTDAGYTEVPTGTETCVAFWEDDPRVS
jgi:peptidyl-tRNA hydrolase